MEELADAIEDAQYVNAIATQEDGPKPVIPWEQPTPLEMEQWEQTVVLKQQRYNQKTMTKLSQTPTQSTSPTAAAAATDTANTTNQTNDTTQPRSPTAFINDSLVCVKPFSMEWTCQQPIGFYLFSEYVKVVQKDYLRINFVEQVIRFRKFVSPLSTSTASNNQKIIEERLLFAIQMIQQFIGYPQIPETKIITQSPPPVEPISSDVAVVSLPPENVASNHESSQPQPVPPEQQPPIPTHEESNNVVVQYIWKTLPPRMEIDEYDLATPSTEYYFNHYRVPSQQQHQNTSTAATENITISPTKHFLGVNNEELTQMLFENCDYPLCSSSIVGLKGPILEPMKHLMTANTAMVRKSEQRLAQQRTASAKSDLFSSSEFYSIVTGNPPDTTAASNRAMSKLHDSYGSLSYNSERTHYRNVPVEEVVGALDSAFMTSSPDRRRSSSMKNDGGSASNSSKNSPVRQNEPPTLNATTTTTDNHDSALLLNGIPATKGSTRTSTVETNVSGPITSTSNCSNISSSITKQQPQQLSTSSRHGNIHNPDTICDTKNTGVTDVPIHFFDTAEYIIMESLKEQYWIPFTQSSYYTKCKHFLWYQDRKIIPDDFYILRVLGRGGFGLVTGTYSFVWIVGLEVLIYKCSLGFLLYFLLPQSNPMLQSILFMAAACKKGTSGKLYAMKVMNKRRIKMKRSESLALNERNALAAVESKFVINLKYAFQSSEDIYFILDLMTGGDLGYHLHQRRRFPKRECLYYAARIMLGLQALHDKGYVFRDVKPENCLLADDGRVKITDLGLATKITPNLNGAAGTRGYWAPEMLRRDKDGKRLTYDHCVDWFSFGCCIAEFISGTNPFRSEAAITFGKERGKATKEKMIDCATLEMNPDFTSEIFESDAVDICRRLLDKNPATRLGRNGCEEIMAHSWFRSLNWESIISDRKRPPFVPPRDVNAASQSQIGNFLEDTVYRETVLTPEDERRYKDLDWTNPRAFAAEVIEVWIYERVTGEPLVPMSQNNGCCCSIS